MNGNKFLSAALLLALMFSGLVFADASANVSANASVSANVTTSVAPTSTPAPSATPSVAASASATPAPSVLPSVSVPAVPVASVVASAGSAVSVTASSNPGAWWLAPNAEVWSCRGNYDVAIAGDLQAAYPAASDLSADVSALQSAEVSLQASATAGDVKAYHQSAVSFEKSFGDARHAINKDWRAFVNDKAVTQAQIDALKAQVKQAQANQEACLLAASKDHVTAKIAYWNGVFARHSAYVANLTAKGVIADGSAITALMTNANAQVIAPLQAAVTAAANRSQVWAADGAYCLDDGCPHGLDLHYSANFDLQVHAAVISVLSTNVSSDANLTANADVSAKLAAAKADLADATSFLASIGSAYYQPGQWQSVSAKLKAVSKDIAQLRHAVANARKGLRQAEQKQRQEERKDDQEQRKQRQKQGNQGIA